MGYNMSVLSKKSETESKQSCKATETSAITEENV